MNIDNFQIKWNGKLLDFDKYAGVQCADGARQWVEDKDGWNMESAFFKPYHGNGKYGDDGVLDGFYSFKAGHISVVKNKEGIDRKGKKYRIDIINNLKDCKAGDLVFTTGTNPWGHVGILIVLDKFPGKFQLFDENGNNIKRPAFWWSNYENKTFVGAMRKVFLDTKPKPTPTPPEPPEPKPLRTYKVKTGDFLNKIAKEQLGNSNRYLEIYELNKEVIGSNPSKILPGQILKLPN